VRQLRDHARRDLIVAQLEGSMHPGELTVQDLLEEAIVRAWHDWHQRPRDESVDRWLVQLIHDVLDEKGFEAPDDKSHSKPQPASDRDAVSVYERVREDDPRFQVEEGADIETNPEFPYANENEWVVENNPYWPSLNPLTRDETIPDEHSPEPWQELADDEMRRLILNELRRFPKNQRRAFMLHALDGWSVEEIAQRQHRSADEVRADIERVRTELRQ
jgi:RNA polymerase sigma factor (sigma-70 family)